ncbi:helix-turn-helix transcriptional regulator [Larkinella sp. VNQ87]|uniref:helix-turn-helix transcriptional regulator n=1 Tax=Larkinella sp. VNQ87 TaxID=3400921 RepID=UPI003C03BA82
MSSPSATFSYSNHRFFKVIRRHALPIEMNQITYRKAVHLIESRYQEEISVRQLCQELNISYYHFIHHFSARKGESVWRYIKRIRLENAFGYLKYAPYSVSQIAELVGFASNHSFSKAFQHYYHRAPLALRKSADYLLPHTFALPGAAPPAVLSPQITLEEMTLPERTFFYKYYEIIPFLIADYQHFQKAENHLAFLQSKDRFTPIGKALETQAVLREVLHLSGILRLEIIQNSSIVLPATPLGNRMVRVGFFVEDQPSAQLLRRYGFWELPFPRGNYVKARVALPPSFGARSAFDIIELVRRNGWFYLRSNTIHLGVTSFLEPLFHLYIPVV